MGLAKPVFTESEAEALAAAASHVLSEEAAAVRVLGSDPERIAGAQRALEKLQQQLRAGRNGTAAKGKGRVAPR